MYQDAWRSLKSLLLSQFSPVETSKAANVSRPEEARLLPWIQQARPLHHPALAHQLSSAGPTAAPFRKESVWHLAGSSGVLTSSKGETENFPGAIFLFDLLSHVFPLGTNKKYFSE